MFEVHVIQINIYSILLHHLIAGQNHTADNCARQTTKTPDLMSKNSLDNPTLFPSDPDIPTGKGIHQNSILRFR